MERGVVDWNDENGLGRYAMLEFIKCKLLFDTPFPRDVASEAVKWASDSAEVLDKVSIEVAEA